MKIMTFNTQHCLNFITKEIDFNVMADAILKCNPDVVSLNEMRGSRVDVDSATQVEKLARLTGMKYYYFAKAIIDPSEMGPYGNGILSKVPITSAETILIPDPVERKYNGYYETRCILKAKLENGLTILITHMGLNPDEQENAVSLVVENIVDKKCILMGDFNVKPDNMLLTPIYEKMLDTAENFCKDGLSFPSDNPYCKIDYIFVSRDIKVNFADIPKIIASDHRPHVAEIEI